MFNASTFRRLRQSLPLLALLIGTAAVQASDVVVEPDLTAEPVLQEPAAAIPLLPRVEEGERWAHSVPTPGREVSPTEKISRVVSTANRTVRRALPPLRSADGIAAVFAILLLAVTIGLLIYDFVDLAAIGIATRATHRIQLLKDLRILPQQEAPG